MAYKVVLIENGFDLRVQLERLIVTMDKEEVALPLNDISVIVLDNLKTKISARLLCSISDHNIALVICDQKHLPTGTYVSYCHHNRAAKVYGYQSACSEVFKKRLWENIVVNKIQNQSKCLAKIKPHNKRESELRIKESEVTYGDETNREAVAAKIYFNCLMGQTYSRGNESLLMNSGLDYGYTILRSYIARVCTGYGLNQLVGIHHKNEYNKFALADDLIEAFRPIIDYNVYYLLKGQKYFKSNHRKKIINILNHQIRYNNKKRFLSNAIEEYVVKFIRAIKEQNPYLMEMVDFDNYLGEV